MKLATAQEVLTRMSLSVSYSGSVSSADSALEAVTPILENIVGSPLAEADRVDFFDHMPSIYQSSSLVREKMYLTQMFVDGDASVYVSADGEPLNSSSVFALDPVTTGIVTSPEVGEVFVTSSAVKEGPSQIAISYSAGFREGSSAIPSWLKEAAISCAIRALHSQAITHGKRDIPDMSQELHRIAYQQLSGHIRPRFGGKFPISSVEL